MSGFYLRQNIDSESARLGIIKGLAYSGAPISEHGPWENLIVDLATLTVAKEKTPILRDHLPSQVAGHGKVTNDGSQVTIEGQLSKKSSYGQAITDLADDGFEWEMSLGVFDYDFEEVVNEEINGRLIEHGWVLRNGVLREVSVVALGADSNTNSEIFSKKKGELSMNLTKEQYIKLACACGGHKDSTPEELETKVQETKLMTEEQKSKIEELEAEIAALKSEVQAKQSEIDAIKADEETEQRETELKTALTAKHIEMAAEKISEAAKTKESTEMLLSVIEAMPKQEKKIEQKFSRRVVIDDRSTTTSKDEPEAIRLKALAMVKSGEAANFAEAMLML